MKIAKSRYPSGYLLFMFADIEKSICHLFLLHLVVNDMA